MLLHKADDTQALLKHIRRANRQPHTVPLMLRTPPYSGATTLSPAIITSGSLSFVEDTNPRGMANENITRPAVLQSAERKISYYDEARKRRRRSSSLMYHEPPETLEHQSDQIVNPNLNAQWVNAKGMGVCVV